MNIRPNLLSDSVIEDPTPIDWYFVTNHLNLYYMMGAGMFLPDNGFGKKYYTDILSKFPGNLVFFANKIPEGAVDMSVQEAAHLIPCVAQVSMKSLKGPVNTIDGFGTIRQNVTFPFELSGDEGAVIFPAPIPISWLKTIHFNSRSDMMKFKEGAQDFNNIDPSLFMTKVKKDIFKKNKKTKPEDIFNASDPFPWTKAQSIVHKVQADIDTALAAGGVLAALYAMADRAELQAVAFRSAFELPTHSADAELDSLIFPLWSWPDELPGHAAGNRLPHKMFWGTVNAIAKDAYPKNSKDVVLSFLNHVVDTWQEVADNEKAKQAIKKLVQELSDLGGSSDYTISELLDLHSKPFSRAVILFFLRKDLRELLEFNHDKLNHNDLISAAVLFGARDGWISIEGDLRGTPQLQNSIVHRMAALAHKTSGTSLDLGLQPEPPAIFRDLFKPHEDKWTAKQKKAALILAKFKKWDCIQTVINLGHGDYTFTSNRAGLQIVLDGMEKGVTHKVDRPLFLKHLYKELSQKTITGRINDEVRKILDNTK
ncbi:hypothetical protein [Desulfobacter latus]|uniref:Uncharacterized protein n=1 Tax=Desulfobacter latus TaxID=2292 RepID=A0A850T9T6_9BACT|nr:hypothetical protein [Desulfobacter latus]NWH06342.1 hypothetical protein [Desulfobacter latus]